MSRARSISAGQLGTVLSATDDPGNPRFHLDACFRTSSGLLLAARGDAARKLFGFRDKMIVKKILRELLGQACRLDIPAPVRGNNDHVRSV